jgi:2-oxoglutarate dehydrogenase E1 component
MDIWQDFHGPNAAYVLEIYQRYQQNPNAVDPTTRALFEQWTPPADGAAPSTDGVTHPAAGDIQSIVGVINLAQAIRRFGHLGAQLDPLDDNPPGDPILEMDTHHLSEEAARQLPAQLIGGPLAEQSDNALEALESLRRVYSATTGYDYEHLHDSEERAWLRQAAESGRFRPPQTPIDAPTLLDQLTQIEIFEKFLHRTFPGKTRFSIEGLDMLVPMVGEIIGGAAEAGIGTILIGMAHRGRLNVLAHILNIPYRQILAEFKDPLQGRHFFIRDELGWTGDVKYHRGQRRKQENGQPVDLVITIPPNPSHLESINPVAEGMARAAGTHVDQAGVPRFEHEISLPILIHGDAGFAGQGVVAETLNLSRLSGYRTGGTIHIVANNQLGYTTLPEEARSTRYASDLAKGFEIPIVHVNADDPEACLEAARLAGHYRHKYQKDFLIDLIGYRRYGHNEGDEPSFTQPLLYEKIRDHATVREVWANTLQERDEIEADWADELVQEKMDNLQQTLDELDPAQDLAETPPKEPPPGAAQQVKTAVALDKLQAMNTALLDLPDDFERHRKLKRAMQRRQEALDNPDEATIDWATAESLALASILADGIAVRMTGQDVERGTFSQRHAIFHNVETGERFIPLQALPQAQAAFEIHNSPLSEAAALGFEYGYNVQAPERLVIWEAQYGDFINNAQTMIDEFIVSARAKWGQTPSLVLLLPHGYEGQGPDHSSAQLERFLQMAAETNMRVANCTTAAQYFHLLRQQAALLQTDPLPLVVMTPKSLLRHPRVASPPRALAEGGWQPVIDDAQADPEQVRRLLLCSGKVYVDLTTAEAREETPEVAIVRLEQLYIFPLNELGAVLEKYPNLREVVWVQEEPQNMGAWSYLQPRLNLLMQERCPLYYLGRPRSSSPAEGSSTWHTATQEKLITLAYNLKAELKAGEMIVFEEESWCGEN